MKRNLLWLAASGWTVLSLMLAACGPAPIEEKKPAPLIEERKPAPVVEEKKQEVVAEKEAVKAGADVPKYGGTLYFVQGGDITGWDDIVTRSVTPGPTFRVTNESMWMGDWAKGPAGGYGTSETDWFGVSDVFGFNTGLIAESWKWSIDEAKNEGTIVYQIRRGIHYALNPASEASRLVGGREVTADDVVFSLRQMVTIPTAYVYRANPELRVAQITKTGPWEVTIKLPPEALISGISRLGNYGRAVPPEVVAKYGNMANWRNSVGSGPFILTDYVAGSQVTMVKNSNYWGKNPVGPGKGDPVPYIDSYRLLIIPDASTRLAALRTGKIDQMGGVNWEDAAQLRRTTPALLETESGQSGYFPMAMRVDEAPFNDKRVRRAMMMATNFEAINQSLSAGNGQIITYPFEFTKAYAALYLNLDDPEMPESVKELYTYNPEKAKQLLKEAGYPNGFKTELALGSSDVDYYSIIKGMWAKVGIDMALDVKESGALNTLQSQRNYKALITNQGRGPVSVFYLAVSLTGEGAANSSKVNDPVINQAVAEIRRASITDLHKAMGMMKELTKYVLDQAYYIPHVSAASYTFWWPWMKGYSAESSLGYFMEHWWANYVWLDQALKQSMGY